jgi:hypothetical protein
VGGASRDSNEEEQMGVVAFWVALAAVLIVGGWLKARGAEMRYRMIMQLVEKGVPLDEAPVRLLLETDKPAAPTHWPPPPVAGRQVAKSFGTVILFGAAGLGIFFAIAGRFGALPARDALLGLAVAAGIATFAVGFFVAARFAADPPPPDGSALPTNH